jgi:hypothetical protein
MKYSTIWYYLADLPTDAVGSEGKHVGTQVGFDILMQSASSGARVGAPTGARRQDGLVRALQELGCRHLVKAYLASIPEHPKGTLPPHIPTTAERHKTLGHLRWPMLGVPQPPVAVSPILSPKCCARVTNSRYFGFLLLDTEKMGVEETVRKAESLPCRSWANGTW